MHKTLRHFRVHLPSGYNAWLQDMDLVAVRDRPHRPDRMQGQADLFARFITLTPPDFWRQ
jgi:hypothetical protein